MEKRNVLLMLLLAGAGGYGIYANWATISVKFGLDDLHPGRIKAIQLAKEAMSWEEYTANSVVLRNRQANGEIKFQGEPWSAIEIQKPRYTVRCMYDERGQRRVHRFAVDIARAAVIYEGLEDGRPAPR